MGRKLDRLMARVSALEEAFTQLLSDNLRHDTVKKPSRKKAGKRAAKNAAPKKSRKVPKTRPARDIAAISAVKPPKAALPKASPIVRPASPTTPVAEPHRATAAPITR
jgi:hypothetical protein